MANVHLVKKRKVEVGSVEVDCAEVIRVIEQFLLEQGLRETARQLVAESGIGLRGVASLSQLVSDAKAGRWDSVLSSLSNLELEKWLLMDVVEQLANELVQNGEKEAAARLIISRAQSLRADFGERFGELEAIVARGSSDTNWSREAGRKKLAEAIERGVPRCESSRLELLLGHALRWQSHVGLLSERRLNLMESMASSSSRKMGERAVKKFAGAISAGSWTRCAAFVAGSGLATGSGDGFIEIWDLDTCRLDTNLSYQAKDELMMHESAVLAVAASKNAEYLASSDAECVKVWRVRTGACVRKFKTSGATILRFTENDTSLLANGSDGDLRLYGLNSGARRRTYASALSDSYIASIELDADHILAASSNTIHIWDYHTADRLLDVPTDTGIVALFAVPSHEGAFVVVHSSHSAILLPLLVNKKPNSNAKPIAHFSTTDLPAKGLPQDHNQTDSEKTTKPSSFVSACLSGPRGYFLYGLAEDRCLYIFDISNKLALEKIIPLDTPGKKVPPKATTARANTRPTGAPHFAGLVAHQSRNYIAIFGESEDLKLWKA